MTDELARRPVSALDHLCLLHVLGLYALYFLAAYRTVVVKLAPLVQTIRAHGAVAAVPNYLLEFIEQLVAQLAAAIVLHAVFTVLVYSLE